MSPKMITAVLSMRLAKRAAVGSAVSLITLVLLPRVVVASLPRDSLARIFNTDEGNRKARKQARREAKARQRQEKKRKKQEAKERRKQEKLRAKEEAEARREALASKAEREETQKREKLQDDWRRHLNAADKMLANRDVAHSEAWFGAAEELLEGLKRSRRRSGRTILAEDQKACDRAESQIAYYRSSLGVPSCPI
jgi:flagellar biosynthesis GTPase FlhF